MSQNMEEKMRDDDKGLKRLLLAGFAMAGILANPNNNYTPSIVSRQARLHADAIIAELNKEQQ